MRYILIINTHFRLAFSRISFIFTSQCYPFRIPVPDTNIFAPASAAFLIFSILTPPSTSIFKHGAISRINFTFSKGSSRKRYPPNPGSRVTLTYELSLLGSYLVHPPRCIEAARAKFGSGVREREPLLYLFLLISHLSSVHPLLKLRLTYLQDWLVLPCGR